MCSSRRALETVAQHVIARGTADGLAANDNEDPSWEIFQSRAAGGNADDLAFTFDCTATPCTTSSAAAGARPPPMVLLTDLEVQKFIQYGHLVIKADFGDAGEIHRSIVRRLDSTWRGPAAAQASPSTEKASRVSPLSAVNECRLPELRQVLGHPAVVGALTSLLGPGYIINQHHHIHLRLPGQAGQNRHKDAYPFDHNIRNPRFQWLFVLYYPHDVVEGHGPTAVLPGRAALESISNSNPARTTEHQELLCVPEGSVVLLHFDSWHRATTTTGLDRRYMLKFQAARMLPPDAPSWDHSDNGGVGTSAEWPPQPAPEAEDLQCVQRDVWRWLCGLRQQSPSFGQQSQQPSDDLHLFQRTVVAADGGQLPYVSLGEPAQQEAREIRAAFRFIQEQRDGKQRCTAQSLLIEIARAARDASTHSIYAKVASNGHGNNLQPPSSALALAAIGDSAVPAILEFLTAACRQQETKECGTRSINSERDASWLEMVHVLTVLGLIAPQDPVLNAKSTAAMLACLGCSQSHWWVRRSAAEALGRILTVNSPTRSVRGLGAEFREINFRARQQLVESLSDPDRRVRRASAISIAQLAIAGKSLTGYSDSHTMPQGGGKWTERDHEAMATNGRDHMLREAARAALEQMVAGDADSYNHFYAALALEAMQAEAALVGPLHARIGEIGQVDDASHGSTAVTTWEISLAAAARVSSGRG